MGFSIKAPPEDVSSGLHLASSMCLKPRYILGRERKLPWHCFGLCHALPVAFSSARWLLRASPHSGEGREACHAEGCTHGNLCPSPKAWAVLTFHPDGSHQAPEVEAGWFSKAELCKLCRDEWDGSASFEGGVWKTKDSCRYFWKVLEVWLPPIEPWLPFLWLPGDAQCEWGTSPCSRYRKTHLRCLLCSGLWQGGGGPALVPARTHPAWLCILAPAAPEDKEKSGLENETERGSAELGPCKPLPQSSSGMCCCTCCGEQEAISWSGQAKVTPSLPLGTPQHCGLQSRECNGADLLPKASPLPAEHLRPETWGLHGCSCTIITAITTRGGRHVFGFTLCSRASGQAGDRATLLPGGGCSRGGQQWGASGLAGCLWAGTSHPACD